MKNNFIINEREKSQARLSFAKRAHKKDNAFIFDKVNYFKNGKATVKIGKFWGEIDANGKWLIKPKYKDLWRFNERLLIADIEGKYGIIDNHENIILHPMYEHLCSLDENLLKAKLNGLYGIIDVQNNIVLDFKYKRLRVAPNHDYFNKEKIYLWAQINNKWGLINEKGEIVLPFLHEYEYDNDFLNDSIIVKKNKGCALVMRSLEKARASSAFHSFAYGKFGVVNLKNEIIISFEYQKLCILSEETLIAEKENGKQIIIDFKNNQIGEREFDFILTPFDISKDALNGARTDDGEGFIDKFGIINKNNEVISAFIYNDFGGCNEDFAVVKKSGKWGFVDKSGIVLQIKPLR